VLGFQGAVKGLKVKKQEKHETPANRAATPVINGAVEAVPTLSTSVALVV
jgi:hypothetical protein